jgi:hypothetical protein
MVFLYAKAFLHKFKRDCLSENDVQYMYKTTLKIKFFKKNLLYKSCSISLAINRNDKAAGWAKLNLNEMWMEHLVRVNQG